MRTTRNRQWIVPAVSAAIALCLLAAGAMIWQIASAETFCPGPLCATHATVQHQIHPLRAEGLWALSAIFTVVALISWLTPRMGNGGAPSSGPLSGQTTPH
jgi:hypothetical protein